VRFRNGLDVSVNAILNNYTSWNKN